MARLRRELSLLRNPLRPSMEGMPPAKPPGAGVAPVRRRFRERLEMLSGKRVFELGRLERKAEEGAADRGAKLLPTCAAPFSASAAAVSVLRSEARLALDPNRLFPPPVVGHPPLPPASALAAEAAFIAMVAGQGMLALVSPLPAVACCC